jgi:adenylate cyclase
MTLRLASTDGTLTFELRPGLTLVLGRALSCDLPVLDPTVSRRHAELVIDAEQVAVRDLGSSNGTFHAGARVDAASLGPGDRITFGKVSFELRKHAEFLIDDSTAEMRRRAARAGTTIIRQVPVPDADQALEQALMATGSQPAVDDASPASAVYQRDRQKLLLLVEISKALTRTATVEQLLERMLHFTFRLLDVDYVALWLFDEAGTLVPRMARTRDGADTARTISPAMVKTVVEQKVAIVSDAEGPSPGANIRSAGCAPLVASEGRVLGVLYVDGARPGIRVSDEDLDFLVAYAGIGAVAIDNIRNSERIRQQARVRENFERFFTPQMAERIAAMPDVLGLGGERREVAVLFADIRGFTEIAAALAPDATAALLTEFFTEMVEVVFAHGGTLDKFIGDRVMAQWGAPIRSDDDADRAIEAALDMLRAVERLNTIRRGAGHPLLQVGIGINFGDAFAGYTGSERRLEYTVIGDSVNTASRLCDWAEGGEIVFSEALHTAFTRPHDATPREPLVLRGKPHPVTVFRAIPTMAP